MNLSHVYEKLINSDSYKTDFQGMYRLMFQLYKEIRIDHTLPVAQPGFDFTEDCLLWEYGNFSLRGHHYFTVNLSRQVLLEKEEDGDIFCVFHSMGIYCGFAREYGGDVNDTAVWCRSPGKLDEFIDCVERYDSVFNDVLLHDPEEFDIELNDNNDQRLPVSMFT